MPLNKKSLKSLAQLDDNQIYTVYEKSINGEITIYTYNDNSILISLEPNLISTLNGNYPKKCNLCLDKNGDSWHQHKNTQSLNHQDLFIEEADYNRLFLENGNESLERPNHTTPLMALMDRAILKFWTNFENNSPPKKDTVKKWLVDQEISEREATAIDMIIRPPMYKKGGNKKRKANKGNTL